MLELLNYTKLVAKKINTFNLIIEKTKKLYSYNPFSEPKETTIVWIDNILTSKY